jgi:hypothetical protein
MESQLDRIEILDPLLTLLDNAWIPDAVPEAKCLSNMLYPLCYIRGSRHQNQCVHPTPQTRVGGQTSDGTLVLPDYSR